MPDVPNLACGGRVPGGSSSNYFTSELAYNALHLILKFAKSIIYFIIFSF